MWGRKTKPTAACCAVKVGLTTLLLIGCGPTSPEANKAAAPTATTTHKSTRAEPPAPAAGDKATSEEGSTLTRDARPTMGKGNVKKPNRSKARPQKVRLGGQRLNDATLKERLADQTVVTSSWMSLELYDNELSAAALDIIDQSTLDTVEGLNIDDNRVGDDGLQKIAELPVFRGLRFLSVANNGITARGVAHLYPTQAGSPAPWAITLDGNKIGDEGVAFIVASPHAESLTTLNLGDAGITDLGAQKIASSPGLSSLTYLYLVGNAITAQGRRTIENSKHLRECEVVFAAEGD